MSHTNRFWMYLLVLVFVAGCRPQEEMQLAQTEPRSITVSGRGEVKVMPDVAQIILFIRTRDKNLLAAKKGTQNIVSNIHDTLEPFNIKNSDIKTEYLNLSPEKPAANPLYNARTAVQITIHDLNKVETILSNVLRTSTANVGEVYCEVTVQGVYFQVSNLEYYKEEARSMAIRDAKMKASVMAEELEQEIGDPLSIQEVPLYPPISPYGFTSALIVNQDYAYLNLNGENTLMFGQITLTSNVTIEFSLK